MLGIMIHDARDATKQTTYLAERGQIVENGGSTYIILETGSVHRQQVASAESTASQDNAIVAYDRYAIDLDQFGADDGKTVYKPRERSTFELLNLDSNDSFVKQQSGRFRVELHERFANPLYALACMMIGFAALGGAKTTRQGRGSAIATAVVAMLIMRISGFGGSSLAARSSVFTPLIYIIPLGTSFLAGLIAWRSMAGVAHTPVFVLKFADMLETMMLRGRQLVTR